MKRLLYLVLLAITSPGCVTLPVSPDNLARLSAKTPPLNVPLKVQESQDYCGIAAVEMVAAYYQKPVSDAGYQRLRSRVPITDGTTGADMQTAFKDAGYFVALFTGALDESSAGLLHHLDAHRPLIVMLGAGSARHYLVVTGYDQAQGVLFVNDPAGYKLAIKYDYFMQHWSASNRFTLLAVP